MISFTVSFCGHSKVNMSFLLLSNNLATTGMHLIYLVRSGIQQVTGRLEMSKNYQHQVELSRSSCSQHYFDTVGQTSFTKDSKSSTNTFGTSHAAKCPPSECSLYQTKLPVVSAQAFGTGASS
jgi:hypothetical protein